MYCTANKLTIDNSLIKTVTALLRESHTSNKAVTALFTTESASRKKAVILPWHTTTLLGEPLLLYANVAAAISAVTDMYSVPGGAVAKRRL